MSEMRRITSTSLLAAPELRAENERGSAGEPRRQATLEGAGMLSGGRNLGRCACYQSPSLGRDSWGSPALNRLTQPYPCFSSCVPSAADMPGGWNQRYPTGPFLRHLLEILHRHPIISQYLPIEWTLSPTFGSSDDETHTGFSNLWY